jgi:hypothetical protein
MLSQISSEVHGRAKPANPKLHHSPHGHHRKHHHKKPKHRHPRHGGR